MTFYAIVRDDDLNLDDPMLDLIDSGRTLGDLRAVSDFDPLQDSSKIVRAKFSVAPWEDHPMQDRSSGLTIAAHICALSAC